MVVGGRPRAVAEACDREGFSLTMVKQCASNAGTIKNGIPLKLNNKGKGVKAGKGVT